MIITILLVVLIAVVLTAAIKFLKCKILDDFPFKNYLRANHLLVQFVYVSIFALNTICIVPVYFLLCLFLLSVIYVVISSFHQYLAHKKAGRQNHFACLSCWNLH